MADCEKGRIVRKGGLSGYGGLWGRADCEEGRIVRKGGLWGRADWVMADCEEGRIVRKGGLWGRADCEEGWIVRLWRIVRKGGLWGRADCEEGQIVRKGGLWGRADCQVMADCEEGRIVRKGGLWGRADCEEGRIVRLWRIVSTGGEIMSISTNDWGIIISTIYKCRNYKFLSEIHVNGCDKLRILLWLCTSANRDIDMQAFREWHFYTWYYFNQLFIMHAITYNLSISFILVYYT